MAAGLATAENSASSESGLQRSRSGSASALAVESRRWEATRSVKRVSSASVDGKGVRKASHGPT